MTETLLDPQVCYRLGRAKALHTWRVLIESGRVVVRTACGIDFNDHAEDCKPVHGFPSCPACIAAEVQA